MTKKEMCSILNVLKSAYPLFYSNARTDTMDKVIAVWYEMLGDNCFDLTNRAVKKMIVSETQIPTIALVRQYIIKQFEQDEIEQKRANAWKVVGCKSEQEYLDKISELRR